jgi:hypothetical protein
MNAGEILRGFFERAAVLAADIAVAEKQDTSDAKIHDYFIGAAEAVADAVVDLRTGILFFDKLAKEADEREPQQEASA